MLGRKRMKRDSNPLYQNFTPLLYHIFICGFRRLISKLQRASKFGDDCCCVTQTHPLHLRTSQISFHDTHFLESMLHQRDAFVIQSSYCESWFHFLQMMGKLWKTIVMSSLIIQPTSHTFWKYKLRSSKSGDLSIVKCVMCQVCFTLFICIIISKGSIVLNAFEVVFFRWFFLTQSRLFFGSRVSGPKRDKNRSQSAS